MPAFSAATAEPADSPLPTAAYASYAGTALVQIASANASHHRLSRFGNRQLNSAIYTIAVIQIRMPSSTGRAFYDKKIAEGKSR
ncbi:hypothetical protein BS297_10970 [Rhodococcus erythropolis]|uniref:Transposase IS116/IS110/IS902 C-terminal domain-containing protein n=1 Tax=Rhodococcus erythropolis TaxID=1833 RepID=A0A5N5EBV9_RHOER|nr:hypothetical protein BS297_10970 [Rhodococcus erythropolis]